MNAPAIKPTLSISSPSHGLRPSAKVSLYTDQAARLWEGAPSVRSKSARPSGAPSLLQAFSVLQALYNATGNDNPFAEAALLRLENGLAEVGTACRLRVSTVSELLTDRAAEGVETPLVTSEKRYSFELVFGTPYHYMLVDAIALLDKAMRHLMTVSLTGLLSGVQVRAATSELQRQMLSTLHHLVRDASTLRRFEGYQVSRTALREQTPAAVVFAAEWANREHTPVTSDILDSTRRPMHVRAKGWKPRS